MNSYLPWIILISHFILLLIIDFFVLHKKQEQPSNKKALGETIFFVMNALVFTGVVHWIYSKGLSPNPEGLKPMQAVVKYLTGYMIELSLSVDNLFVIAVIFTGYKIPGKYQHRLLFLGILGAIVFRALLISVGLVLIREIHGIGIFFGLFLLYTAFNMLRKEQHNEEEKEDRSTKGIARYFNISNKIDGSKFRTEVNGKKMFTALFGALLSIEFTDLLFALDSIPAIFAITTDPFLVFSSNIYAIMGLRSMYFFLANMLEKFQYLKYSVFAILLFVGLELMTAELVDIPEWFSLSFIVLSLALGVWISILRMRSEKS